MYILPLSNYQHNKFQNNCRIASRSTQIKPLVYDSFYKQKISFKSNYTQEQLIFLIKQIDENKIKESGQGYHSAFYKFKDMFGVKVAKPLYPERINADFVGENNIKEFFILNHLNKINPELAVTPLDLIEYNKKHYLVLDIVRGKHPFEAKLSKESIKDIIDKTFELDINGIMHCDLQDENIFINSNNKTKFIDFGSYTMQIDNGEYICSDGYPADVFKSIVEKNSTYPKEKRFTKVFSLEFIPYDLKNYSDNTNLKIMSNIANFEHRTVFEYIKYEQAEDPKEFLASYLKLKSTNYHSKMIAFLENLETFDADALSRKNKAIETEKIFEKVFANPSEKVLKTELEKMQLKVLIGNGGDDAQKAYSYYESLLLSIKNNIDSTSGDEKAYFKEMEKTISTYKIKLDNDLYKGKILEEKDDVARKVFQAKLSDNIAKSTNERKPTNIKSNKKGLIIMLAMGLLGICLLILNRVKNKKQADITLSINKKE